ncbi:MAG TPA: hypothetical protein VK963_01660 [Candidatus Saccharimonadales bacterium]|nr:hypothetical protein [Candidatus Saccharimonadales bacterium]
MTDDELRRRIGAVLERNRRRGYSRGLKQHYDFIKPAGNRYPFQYFWDTCFHVFILDRLGRLDEAKQQLRSLFQLQQPDGFVGHEIYWQSLLPAKPEDILQARLSLTHLRPAMSALIQPPLVAWAASRIFHGSGDRTFLEEMLPKFKLYFDWLAENRDFDGDGLISIITPYESGIDYKPSFDEALGFGSGRGRLGLYLRAGRVDLANFWRRYHLPAIYQAKRFIVKEVTYNTLYAHDLEVLAGLLETIHDPDARRYRQRAEQVGRRLVELMYDAETAAFYDINVTTGRHLQVLTPSIFAPLILSQVTDTVARSVIDRHFSSKQEFQAPFPLPSVATSHPAFFAEESHYIWRGPTWIAYNWLTYQALRQRGFDQPAATLYRSTRQLIDTSGFREYYNPFTGAGYGAINFTWSGLVLDMMD